MRAALILCVAAATAIAVLLALRHLARDAIEQNQRAFAVAQIEAAAGGADFDSISPRIDLRALAAADCRRFARFGSARRLCGAARRRDRIPCFRNRRRRLRRRDRIPRRFRSRRALARYSRFAPPRNAGLGRFYRRRRRAAIDRRRFRSDNHRQSGGATDAPNRRFFAR